MRLYVHRPNGERSLGDLLRGLGGIPPDRVRLDPQPGTATEEVIGDGYHARMPVAFTCRETLPLPPAAIAGQILDLARWPGFTGYGPLPGVRSAAFDTRTPEVVGTRIRVTNADGSCHVETIVAWEPARLAMHMGEFTPPLARLAVRFEEEWAFEPAPAGTRVARTFRLHPKSALARPAVWLISLLLRRAVARHLRRMRDEAEQPSSVLPIGDTE